MTCVPVRYDFNEADHVEGHLRLKRERQLRVVWDAHDEAADLPAAEATTATATRSDTKTALFYPVMTCGDGGCSMHAASGRPSATRELFEPAARDLASRLLRDLPTAAVADPTSQTARLFDSTRA
eukprot:6299183-Pyramimonas_sp.AAC.1